jgi:hypothetical protein
MLYAYGQAVAAVKKAEEALAAKKKSEDEVRVVHKAMNQRCRRRRAHGWAQWHSRSSVF